MNKLIAKTATITACVLLFACFVVYSCFALFAPSIMSEFYDGVGNGSVALKYAQRAYQKDPTEDNLVIALQRAVAADNSEKIVEFSESLLFKNNRLPGDKLVFFQYKYCAALYDLNQNTEAINKAVGFSTNYLPGNALECLAASALEKKDVKFIKLMLPYLELVADSPEVQGDNLSRVREQIELLNSFCNTQV